MVAAVSSASISANGKRSNSVQAIVNLLPSYCNLGGHTAVRGAMLSPRAPHPQSTGAKVQPSAPVPQQKHGPMMTARQARQRLGLGLFPTTWRHLGTPSAAPSLHYPRLRDRSPPGCDLFPSLQQRNQPLGARAIEMLNVVAYARTPGMLAGQRTRSGPASLSLILAPYPAQHLQEPSMRYRAPIAK